MKVTIKDVAKAAGVSASTVSRALHDNSRISPEVRQRVQQVAREMDFHPNQMARSLVNRQTHIVGIVFPGAVDQSLGHPFYPSVLQGLGRAASERRYHLLLATGSEVVSSADAGRDLVDSGYIGGLVLLAAEDAPAQNVGVPMVVIGHPANAETPYYVDNDNIRAGRHAVHYLTHRGHERILFLGYDKQFMVTVDRRKGYEQALSEAGLPFRREWVVHSRHLANDTDSEQLRQIFLSADRPTAVVCMDDAQAIAISRLLGALNLRVPDDVSLVSFNNTEAGRYHNPPLTSFDVNAYQLGVSAMNLMLDVIAGDITEPTSIEVPFILEERGSVRDLTQKEN